MVSGVLFRMSGYNLRCVQRTFVSFSHEKDYAYPTSLDLDRIQMSLNDFAFEARSRKNML